MTWIVGVFLVMILFGGIARLLLAFRDPTEKASVPGRFPSRQSMLVLGMVNTLGGTVGLFCLANQLWSQLVIFLSILVVTSLPAIAFRVGTTNVKR